ncbi:MAG: YaiI/YqxD family protein [Oscillospiraceae bacterium]
MQILIDGDGCPVVDITIKIAGENRLNCIIICDTSHVFERVGASTITVSKGADSVDFALVNKVESGDIVITQDYGLAAMCLARKAISISQNGMVYDENNMDQLLLQRHIAKKIRMAGGRLKGNAKRTKQQDIMFEQTLRQLIEQSQQGK